MNPFLINLLAGVVGWIAWTFFMLSVYKDDNEKTFNFRAYFWEYWDNWVASLVMIPVLIYVGYKKLDLGVIGGGGWSELYYLGSGFVTELAKVAWKKWKTKNG